jgi:2-methylthioadenine synthetase
VDITSYGGDLPGRPSLGQMVRRLLAQVPELERLRLSSLDPVGIDDDLLRVIAEEPRLMPHLHLSVQAGDDVILKRMKRRHLRGDVIALSRRIRAMRPEVAFGADLIAGFPTEAEAMFANSLALVEECKISHLHVFPFSPRPGTPAARMPQVPGDVARERAARLRAAGARMMADRLAGRVGGIARVLIEKDGFGHSEDFLPVNVDRPPMAGGVAAVRLTAVVGEQLTGEVTE